MDGFKFREGDVCVMTVPSGEYGKTGAWGHVCMYDGVHWVSDFQQPRFYVYNGGKLKNTTVCLFYRFAGKISNEKKVCEDQI